MKKRVKLFTSIASLCLAIALMAFGVYAATKVSFTATSKVTFSATEIMGYYTLEVAGGNYTGTYATGNSEQISVADADDNGAEVTNDITLPDIALTADNNTVTYTVKFTVTGEVMADVTVTAAEVAEKAGYSVSVDKAGKQTTTDAAKTVTFVVTVRLDTSATGFNAAEASDYTITINADAVPAA